MLASRSASVMASTLAQSVRLSPRRRILSSCSPEKRTVSFFFCITCSPHRDDANDLASPRPNNGDQTPIQLADAQPAFFRQARRRDRTKRAAIKQNFGIDKIQPTSFQYGYTLGLGPLKVHPSPNIATGVGTVKA